MLNEYQSDRVSNLQAYIYYQDSVEELVKTPNRYSSIQNTKEKSIPLKSSSEEDSLNQFRELNTKNNKTSHINN